MTQTIEKPIQLTYHKLREKFQANFPHLIAPLEQVKDKLDRGEGAGDLTNIIRCEVKVDERDTSYVYSWTGQNGGNFECLILKPSVPQLQRPPPAPEAAPKTSKLQLVSDDVTIAPEKAPATPHMPDEEQAVKVGPSEEMPEPTPAPVPTTPAFSSGIFAALAELMGSSTLLMTLAKHDNELTVNVMPFGDDTVASVSAVCLTGTPSELDEGFVEAIRVKVKTTTSLAEQVDALKAADKALVDAKKAETDAKKAEAAKKTKATEDKKKAQEKEVEAKNQQEAGAAERAGKQEAIF